MNCPVCKAAVLTKYRPFCSKRCADHDLVNWLDGNYASPLREEDDLDGLTLDDASADHLH